VTTYTVISPREIKKDEPEVRLEIYNININVQVTDTFVLKCD